MIIVITEGYLQKRIRVPTFIQLGFDFKFLESDFYFYPFMKNFITLIKPKLTAAEKKFINMVIDGLRSENSRRAYQRHLQEFFIWDALEN